MWNAFMHVKSMMRKYHLLAYKGSQAKRGKEATMENEGAKE
jgi:hypothetical protein